MGDVDVDSEVTDKQLRQTNTLATKPVSMEELVCVAIQSEVVLEGLQDGELGEDAQTRTKNTTAMNRRATRPHSVWAALPSRLFSVWANLSLICTYLLK